jgi:hypothetical protein
MLTSSNANEWDNYIVKFNISFGALPYMFKLLIRHHQGYDFTH